MRSLATCYNDHAVKVSDSYCSAYPNRSYLSPRQMTSAQNAVASTYKVKLSPHKHLLVTITWSTKLLCRGFWFSVADKAGSNSSSPLRMGAEKGKEIFGACGSTLQVYWDLSNAKFDGPGPEPVGSFYVVVLIDSLPGLLLGDMGEDPFVGKLAPGGLPTVGSSMVSQCQHLSGSTHFSTRARFRDSGQAHEVVIRCGADVDGREGPKEGPVLSVLIDQRRVVRVTRLKWNFRGNHLVFVDGLMVDVMWDLHRWMRDDQGGLTARDGGFHGVFMFRTRSGLNSRLWFEEKKLAEENHDKVEFSFLVCATRNSV